jgi:hypothetical protein
MIPPYIKFDSKASPPQWTDNGDQVIEKGTHVRVKIKGTRNEMGQLFAIATINEVRLCSIVLLPRLTRIVGFPGVRLMCFRLPKMVLTAQCHSEYQLIRVTDPRNCTVPLPDL